MPNILFLLPGNPVNHKLTDCFTSVVGEDVFGKSYTFREVELINNFQTIRAIQAFLGTHWLIHIRYQVFRKKPADLVKYSWALSNFVREHHISLVHQFWGGPPAFFNAFSLKVPFILSLLGSDLLGAYNQSLRPTFHGKLLRFFSNMAARQASAVVVMSEKMKLQLKFGSTPVHIIPEGIDTYKFYPIEKEVACRYLGWSLEGFKVLFFNYGQPVKNSPLAYKVFSYVKKLVPNAILVEVKGVAHEELVYYYNACDALLLTSLHEGSNNSLKEAMACGCPVVSSAVGDAHERLSGVKPSMVVEGFQPDDYAACLIDIARERRRSNGPEMVASISLPFVAAQMVDVYKNVLKPDQEE